MKSKQYKHRQRKQKQERKRQRLPKINIGICSHNQQFKDDFASAIAIKQVDIADSFWREVPTSWRKAVVDYRNRAIKLTAKDFVIFRSLGSSTLCRIVQKVTVELHPRYKTFNYSFDMISTKWHNYVVFLDILETKSTPRGSIHLLPNLRYPPNKQLGLTTHAIEQMDSRIFDDVADNQSVVLRAPTFLIPYKHNIFALYSARQADNLYTFNGIPAACYMLLGYLPIEDHGELLVGITHLKPGYRQTPEQHLTKDQIANNRGLVIVNNTVHRLVDINKNRHYTTVPYDVDCNPNINLLLNIHKLLLRAARHGTTNNKAS